MVHQSYMINKLYIVIFRPKAYNLRRLIGNVTLYPSVFLVCVRLLPLEKIYFIQYWLCYYFCVFIYFFNFDQIHTQPLPNSESKKDSWLWRLKDPRQSDDVNLLLISKSFSPSSTIFTFKHLFFFIQITHEYPV